MKKNSSFSSFSEGVQLSLFRSSAASESEHACCHEEKMKYAGKANASQQQKRCIFYFAAINITKSCFFFFTQP